MKINTDKLTVMVEVNENLFSDEISKLNEFEKKVGAKLKQALGILLKLN